MQAIQLDVFSSTLEQMEESFSSTVDRVKLDDKQSENIFLNPCEKCDYKGICSSDDCAMKLYPIDVPTMRFSNLQEYVLFMKQHDWL